MYFDDAAAFDTHFAANESLYSLLMWTFCAASLLVIFIYPILKERPLDYVYYAIWLCLHVAACGWLASVYGYLVLKTFMVFIIFTHL